MVVGEPFSGKSCLLQVLKDGWQLSHKIDIYREEKEKDLNARYLFLQAENKPIEMEYLDL